MIEPSVFLINSGYDGCNYVRINQPCTHNGYKTDKHTLSEDRRNIQEIKEELLGSDVVVFHRAEERTYHNLAKMLKESGKKIVMDNDDTFLLEDHHPLAQFNPDGTPEDNLQKRNDALYDFIRMSDLVTTTTETLANEYRKINKNVVVLPNCVDPDDWEKPLRNNGKKVRIGIAGSAALEYDYLHIKNLLRKLSKRDDIELCMFGLGDKEHRLKNPIVTKVFKDEYEFWDSIKVEHIAWCPIYLYPEKLNELRLDIMIIPRKDNYFNRCKSNLKFLEASMCEIPVIAQSFDNGPYEEITPDMGVLIKDNSKWEEEIERLVKDKKLRRQMGKQSRKYVLKHYDINNNAYKWADAYKSLFYEKTSRN